MLIGKSEKRLKRFVRKIGKREWRERKKVGRDEKVGKEDGEERERWIGREREWFMGRERRTHRGRHVWYVCERKGVIDKFVLDQKQLQKQVGWSEV